MRILDYYKKSTLAAKIRISYVVMFLPIMLLLLFSLYNIFVSNREYEEMIKSVGLASEFSLDFKQDFDYETYLLVVENKTMEESGLSGMLSQAKRVIGGLKKITTSQENEARLESAEKYLDNLDGYKNRIEKNLREGNKYDENIEIWEKDVQIVSSLVQETIHEYIYYEIKILQSEREDYRQNYKMIIRVLFITFCGMIILFIIWSYFIPVSITRPIRKLCMVTDQVAGGDLSVRSGVVAGEEITKLSMSLNSMLDKIGELLEQVKEEQSRLRKAGFAILQAQINPHFLYNTLDAVVWLAESGDRKQVVKMIGSLSDFFRATLTQGKDIVQVSSELNHVRSYLEIQQIRYQDILQYEIQVPRELECYLIPKLTLQPLVENALYHGIKNKRGKGKIRVSGRAEPERFVLAVEDNGIGITKERLQQVRKAMKEKNPSREEIYGLFNVNERIRLNFGEDYGVSVYSEENEWTRTEVVLPYQE